MNNWSHFSLISKLLTLIFLAKGVNFGRKSLLLYCVKSVIFLLAKSVSSLTQSVCLSVFVSVRKFAFLSTGNLYYP